MAYEPKLQEQLDGSKTGGDDCVPRSSSMAIDWATTGAKVPTVADFRKRAGKLTGGLNTEQCQKGMSSYDSVAETKGYTDIRAYRKLRQPKSTLRTAVSGGRFVILWISYAVINELDAARKYSGDPRFMGNHAVGVLGQRVREGSVEWEVFDPVADGRRKGIAKGPDWIPRWIMEAAAEGVTKHADTFTGLVVYASRKT